MTSPENLYVPQDEHDAVRFKFVDFGGTYYRGHWVQNPAWSFTECRNSDCNYCLNGERPRLRYPCLVRLKGGKLMKLDMTLALYKVAKAQRDLAGPNFEKYTYKLWRSRYAGPPIHYLVRV